MADCFLTEDSVVTATEGQLSSRLDGEVVILDLTSGAYFGLNAVGARVWEMAQQSVPFRVIRETIASEFDVEPEQCRRDLSDLITNLQSEGLVQVAPGTG